MQSSDELKENIHDVEEMVNLSTTTTFFSEKDLKSLTLT
jgi:hypothetical protein